MEHDRKLQSLLVRNNQKLVYRNLLFTVYLPKVFYNRLTSEILCLNLSIRTLSPYSPLLPQTLYLLSSMGTSTVYYFGYFRSDYYKYHLLLFTKSLLSTIRFIVLYNKSNLKTLIFNVLTIMKSVKNFIPVIMIGVQFTTTIPFSLLYLKSIL